MSTIVDAESRDVSALLHARRPQAGLFLVSLRHQLLGDVTQLSQLRSRCDALPARQHLVR